jgi:hypothetical protein
VDTLELNLQVYPFNGFDPSSQQSEASFLVILQNSSTESALLGLAEKFGQDAVFTNSKGFRALFYSDRDWSRFG